MRPKQKPTQHSVKELRSIGLQPDILVCRCENFELPPEARKKIALFTNVEEYGVISLKDVDSIYQVPLILHEQGLDQIVVSKLELKCNRADLTEWQHVEKALAEPDKTINLAMIGKYFDLLDSYKSLIEAITHAGIRTGTKVEIHYVDAEEIENDGTEQLEQMHAILVPGGFGQRGFEGKIRAAGYARTNNVPYLGICYGLHAAVIEFARNEAGLLGAHSTEVDPDTEHPVIGLVTEWRDADGSLNARDPVNGDLGGTMRLGAQECLLNQESLAFKMYGKPVVFERHRHRYEVNGKYRERMENCGMVVSGVK